jgi:hypothetical protein
MRVVLALPLLVCWSCQVLQQVVSENKDLRLSDRMNVLKYAILFHAGLGDGALDDKKTEINAWIDEFIAAQEESEVGTLLCIHRPHLTFISWAIWTCCVRTRS